MWNAEEFVGKAKLYFTRSAEADESSEERVLWLLLGLEFLLRAPLARVHPTLLAVPEGDSILHAAGVGGSAVRPRSVPAKTVIDRLGKIHATFGQDRGKDALFLTELRNSELHSSEAALGNAEALVWMPKFLSVLEAVCEILGSDPGDFLDESVLDQARSYTETADRKVQHEVAELVKNASLVFGALKSEEVAARLAAQKFLERGYRYYVRDCPACDQHSLVVQLSPGRSSNMALDEDTDEITYRIVRVATSADCRVCGLTLSSTAQVMAAGVKRLDEEVITEDRYEGWEERMTYQDALDLIGGEEYGNE